MGPAPAVRGIRSHRPRIAAEIRPRRLDSLAILRMHGLRPILRALLRRESEHAPVFGIDVGQGARGVRVVYGDRRAVEQRVGELRTRLGLARRRRRRIQYLELGDARAKRRLDGALLRERGEHRELPLGETPRLDVIDGQCAQHLAGIGAPGACSIAAHRGCGARRTGCGEAPVAAGIAHLEYFRGGGDVLVERIALRQPGMRRRVANPRLAAAVEHHRGRRRSADAGGELRQARGTRAAARQTTVGRGGWAGSSGRAGACRGGPSRPGEAAESRFMGCFSLRRRSRSCGCRGNAQTRVLWIMCTAFQVAIASQDAWGMRECRLNPALRRCRRPCAALRALVSRRPRRIGYRIAMGPSDNAPGPWNPGLKSQVPKEPLCDRSQPYFGPKTS